MARLVHGFGSSEIAWLGMPEPPLQVELRYRGPLVDDGTMSLNDVVKALQAFAGAYGKAADTLLSGTTHELLVSAVEVGSFRLVIQAFLHAPAVSDGLKAVGGVTAKWVFDKIKEAIQAKKHLKGGPLSPEIRDNKIALVAMDGGTINITPEALRLLEGKTLDADLKRLIEPLSEGFVDGLDLTTVDDKGLRDEESIEYAQKSYFADEGATEDKREVVLEGTLVSASKESLRGTFKLRNGNKVPYHYVGQDKVSLHGDYAYNGPLRVTGMGKFDASAVLMSIDITSAIRLQERLAL
jgi:hypothetical protein